MQKFNLLKDSCEILYNDDGKKVKNKISRLYAHLYFSYMFYIDVTPCWSETRSNVKPQGLIIISSLIDRKQISGCDIAQLCEIVNEINWYLAARVLQIEGTQVFAKYSSSLTVWRRDVTQDKINYLCYIYTYTHIYRWVLQPIARIHHSKLRSWHFHDNIWTILSFPTLGQVARSLSKSYIMYDIERGIMCTINLITQE